MYAEQLCEDAELLGRDDKLLLSVIYELLHVKEESVLKGMMACICLYQYVLIVCILGIYRLVKGRRQDLKVQINIVHCSTCRHRTAEVSQGTKGTLKVVV